MVQIEAFVLAGPVNRLVVRWMVACCWLVVTSLTSISAEPVREFVEGLRERGYSDMALIYLDEVEKRSNLPPELRELLPYERAQTLLTSARELGQVDAQRQQLDAAEAAFQQFSRSSPNHPLAAQANTWRGRILFEKARVEIFEADDPSHQSNRREFQSKARALLIEARRVFEAATSQNKQVFDQFPSFIPEHEKAKQAERARAENTYIETVFDTSKCQYWLARTYDRGDPEATQALKKAMDEFTEMYDRTRTNTGGKFARLWQGKCFEEMDQITQALGVYEDLLALTPDTPVKAAIYDLALRFKLICLNHPQKKDYSLVVTLAEEWLAQAKGRTRSEVGMGIQWELCRALEQVGKETSLTEADRTAALNKALTRARFLSRVTGEFRAPSNAMIQRLLLALNRQEGSPTDFETAYGMAAKLSEDIRQLSAEIAKAQQARNTQEAQTKQADLQLKASNMSKLAESALKMARPTTDPGDLFRASVLLAYGYLADDRLLEAAAVGEYTMRSLAQKSPENSKNAGLIAMLAFDRAYQKGQPGKRDFEARKLIEFASRLEAKFPQSEQANDARLAVARVLWDERKLDEAATWWNKVPSGTSHYAGAQLSTGQAYWGQFTTQINLAEDKRPSAEKLAEWKAAAIRHLEIGINERMRSTPTDAAAPDDMIRGKITLAQIRNLDGAYHTQGTTLGSIELLTHDPHSVVSAIAVPEGSERPTSQASPKSRTMASFAYQQLLKALIGAKELDAARDARAELERVAGSDDAEALTEVFVEFGQELERELSQLKAAGELDRMEEVREGFETFLNDLFQREDGQNFTSLFWIAETFTSLAESSAEDADRAQSFFSKAADAYQKIIDKAKATPAFAQPDQLLYSKMRLVNCKQLQSDFSGGELLLRELLKDRKAADSPNIQFAAASLYQSWASSSEPEAWKKYPLAIQGSKAPVVIWGWAYTAQRLQRVQQSRSDARLATLEFDARYNLGVCQFAYAKQVPEATDRTQVLTQAKSAIETFARLSRSFPPEQFDRFNALYREIQQESGTLPVDLPVGKSSNVAPEHSAQSTTTAETTTSQTPDNTPEAPSVQTQPVAATTDYGMIAVLTLLGIAGIAGVLYVTMRRPPKRYGSRRASVASGEGASATSALNFGNLEVNSPPPVATSTAKSPANASPQPSLPPSPTTSPNKPRPTKLPGQPRSAPPP